MCGCFHNSRDHGEPQIDVQTAQLLQLSVDQTQGEASKRHGLGMAGMQQSYFGCNVSRTSVKADVFRPEFLDHQLLRRSRSRPIRILFFESSHNMVSESSQGAAFLAEWPWERLGNYKVSRPKNTQYFSIDVRATQNALLTLNLKPNAGYGEALFTILMLS